MFKRSAILVACGLLFASCASEDPNAAQTRTVLVDYSFDEFATTFLHYFPRTVTVRPGDTVEFRQTWTGEPHSVTMGTIVDEYGEAVEPFYETFRKKGYEGLPGEPPKEVMKIEEQLPWLQDEHTVQQNGAQPCYLEEGAPPKDPDEPCPPENRKQPEFNGRYSYYNSGFIPYEGAEGNTYRVPIAEDVEPGKYFYYCNYHGPFMSGYIDVVEKGTELRSRQDVNRDAQREVNAVADPLREAYEQYVEGRFEPPPHMADALKKLGLTRERGGKTYLHGNYSGAQPATSALNASILEFIPENITVRAGEKITWMNFGLHTISFNVPDYFPIYEVEKDGKVVLNPKIAPPAGGAPDPEESQPEEEGPGGPPKPVVIDAGTFDGEGFWSSGLIAGFGAPVVYSVRISKPGTYKYACLIHPQMVGTLEVGEP